jgi:hypothetical protein
MTGIFKKRNGDRNTEKISREWWLKHYRGETIEVWAKKADRVEIHGEKISLRWSEEVRFDMVFKPKGRPLEGRQTLEP